MVSESASKLFGQALASQGGGAAGEQVTSVSAALRAEQQQPLVPSAVGVSSPSSVGGRVVLSGGASANPTRTESHNFNQSASAPLPQRQQADSLQPSTGSREGNNPPQRQVTFADAAGSAGFGGGHNQLAVGDYEQGQNEVSGRSLGQHLNRSPLVVALATGLLCGAMVTYLSPTFVRKRDDSSGGSVLSAKKILVLAAVGTITALALPWLTHKNR